MRIQSGPPPHCMRHRKIGPGSLVGGGAEGDRTLDLRIANAARDRAGSGVAARSESDSSHFGYSCFWRYGRALACFLVVASLTGCATHPALRKAAIGVGAALVVGRERKHERPPDARIGDPDCRAKPESCR